MRYLSPIPPLSLEINIPASRPGREFGQFWLAILNQTLTTSRTMIISSRTCWSHPTPTTANILVHRQGVKREL
jgi:hypothetical protein